MTCHCREWGSWKSNGRRWRDEDSWALWRHLIDHLSSRRGDQSAVCREMMDFCHCRRWNVGYWNHENTRETATVASSSAHHLPSWPHVTSETLRGFRSLTHIPDIYNLRLYGSAFSGFLLLIYCVCHCSYRHTDASCVEYGVRLMPGVAYTPASCRPTSTGHGDDLTSFLRALPARALQSRPRQRPSKTAHWADTATES